MIPDQKHMWDTKHANRPALEWQADPDPFATSGLSFLKPGDRLLELGCGTGIDARFFAQNRITTLATDFSEAVIERNKNLPKLDNLTYQVLDIVSKYPFDSESFDSVYACLSLHYFIGDQTKTIFREIHRILKRDGLLIFRCKSTRDPHYGEGEEIAPNIFIRNGHIRHLFTVDYAKELLGKNFAAVKLEEAEGVYAGLHSFYVDCVARKI